MPEATNFYLLGSVEVRHGGQALPLPGPRQTRFLAALLLNAGQTLSVDRIASFMWDEAEQPPTAIKQVRNAASAIRQVLAAAGVPEDIVVTDGPGYQIRLADAWLDVHAFDAGVTQAHQVADTGDVAEAVCVMRAALGLWRGPPLCGLDGLLFASRAHQLSERRLAAIEECVDYELQLGSLDEVIDELVMLTVEHPTRERLWGHLMLALYRSDRQADALKAYEELRRGLADELGIDPSPRIQRLHQQILRTDSAIDPPAIAVRSAAPQMLPREAGDFTGRDLEYAALSEHLRAPRRCGVAITAIDGMGGIGKTALALHIAHAVAPDFPDGQLFIDLLGYTPDQEPLDPYLGLDTLLRMLGVPAQAIPGLPEQRAALWRSRLAGKRVLVVLDNAADHGQVAPLLPASPGNAVIVTSRRRMVELDGVATVSLDVLAKAEATAMFSAIVGPRAVAEPQAVDQVTELCSCVPLAIRIAGARLAHRPQWSVAHLARRLAENAERPLGDRSVAGVIAVSYEHLNAHEQAMLLTLVIHPGADLDAHAAAALTAVSPRMAETLLEALLDCHLLVQRSPDRYAIHDLIRQHLRSVSGDMARRREALDRLFTHYIATVEAALGEPALGGPGIPEPAAGRFPDPDAAAAWLAAETDNLLAVALQASAARRGDVTRRLSKLLSRPWELGARYDEAVSLHSAALKTMAPGVGDPAARTQTMASLAVVLARTGRYEEATELHQQALAVALEAGDLPTQAAILSALGTTLDRAGQYRPALEAFTATLRLYRDLGNRTGEAVALSQSGSVLSRLGAREAAIEQLQRAKDIAMDTEDQFALGLALTNLGAAYYRLARYAEARDSQQEALKLAQELGHRVAECVCRGHLGGALARLGNANAATRQLDCALALAADTGYQSGKILAYAYLAAMHEQAEYEQADRGDMAIDCHHQVLRLANAVGVLPEQAYAHLGLGRIYLARGEPGPAVTHLERAHELLTELGLPEAQLAVALLADLSSRRPR